MQLAIKNKELRDGDDILLHINAGKFQQCRLFLHANEINFQLFKFVGSKFEELIYGDIKDFKWCIERRYLISDEFHCYECKENFTSDGSLSKHLCFNTDEEYLNGMTVSELARFLNCVEAKGYGNKRVYLNVELDDKVTVIYPVFGVSNMPHSTGLQLNALIDKGERI